METTQLPAESAETKPEETSSKDLSINLNWVKKINPKYLGIAVVVVAVAAFGFYYKSLFVAATVDGHVITRLSVVKELEKQNGKATLDTLINNQLIENAAAKQKLTVSDADMNAQIDKIKTGIESQGGTLDSALSQASMTMDQLKTQIKNELLLEKLLGDKIAVSDDEVNSYISGNKITVEAGKEAETKDQVKQQLKQNKITANGQAFLDDLHKDAKINTYVTY